MINNRQHVECREIGFEIVSFLKPVCHGDTRTSRSDIFESTSTRHFVDNGMPLYVGRGAEGYVADSALLAQGSMPDTVNYML